MEPILKALNLKSEFDQLRPIPKDKEAVIMQKFRLDWNYHSNNLEGNSLTFGETKALILFGITAQGKPLKDHFEIAGHDKAIKWILDIVKGDYPLTENFIRELHELLLKEPYKVNAITPDGQPTTRLIAIGRYKTTPNHVRTKTGEIFRFASPEETPALMHDLIHWYRTESESIEMNPLILAAEFHYRFIRIHPFDDGNGRVARILMNFILMKHAFPPVIIKTEDKANYFTALRQADAGIIQPFFDYIANSLCRSLEIMIAGAKGESIEESDDLDKEIALLKQRLKEDDSVKKIERTKDKILEIYDNSLLKFWEKFIHSCSKFDGFYLKTKQWIESALFGFDGPNQVNEARSAIDESVNEIFFTYEYDTFSLKKSKNFSYKSRIFFHFTLDGEYTIRINDNNDPIIKKRFGYPIEESEMELILRSITKQHKEFIEENIGRI